MYYTKKGQPISKDLLLKALTKLANLLKCKNKKIELVVCGGVVSLLFLNSRKMTQDVDAIFPENKENRQVLIQLIDEVASDLGLVKGKSPWFNDAVSFFGLETVSDVIVFNHPNLKLKAAAWEELLAHKIHAFRHQVDILDAVEILKQIKYPIKQELFQKVIKYAPFSPCVADAVLEKRFEQVWHAVYLK